MPKRRKGKRATADLLKNWTLVNMDSINEVKPFIKDSDTQMNVIFKAGFYACIKAVEDQGNDLLVLDLKDILKKM